MEVYPSITSGNGQSFQAFKAHVFDKLDGSNLRFEWARKRGWYKSGTRQRLFDRTDLEFGTSLDVFEHLLAEPLERIARKQRWNNLVVFTEFWGPNSLGGVHDPSDPKTLTVFDAAPDRGDLLDPRDFLKFFENVPTPRYLGKMNWTRELVEQIRHGEIDGITSEGAVGKAGEGKGRIAAKAKTQAWIDAIMARYGNEEGSKIVAS